MKTINGRRNTILVSFVLTGAVLFNLTFAYAAFESTSPQGLEPAKVAAAIKANAQALKAFSWQ